MENLFRLFTHASVQFLLNKHKTDVEKEGGKLWVKLFFWKKLFSSFSIWIFCVKNSYSISGIFDTMLKCLTQFFQSRRFRKDLILYGLLSNSFLPKVFTISCHWSHNASKICFLKYKSLLRDETKLLESSPLCSFQIGWPFILVMPITRQ